MLTVGGHVMNLPGRCVNGQRAALLVTAQCHAAHAFSIRLRSTFTSRPGCRESTPGTPACRRRARTAGHATAPAPPRPDTCNSRGGRKPKVGLGHLLRQRDFRHRLVLFRIDSQQPQHAVFAQADECPSTYSSDDRVRSGWLHITLPVASSMQRSSAFSVCRPLEPYR